MVSRFTASQSVHLGLPGPLGTVQAYLDEPGRIVYALFDADRVQVLTDAVFRLRMQTLGFFMLQVTPTVDLRVWTDASHTLCIEAVDCQLAGADALTQQFKLALTGRLQPTSSQQRRFAQEAIAVAGNAELAVDVELPPPLAALSGPLLQTTGNRLLNSVLVSVKRRLVQQLKLDYQQWAAKQLSKTAH